MHAQNILKNHQPETFFVIGVFKSIMNGKNYTFVKLLKGKLDDTLAPHSSAPKIPLQ